MKFIFEKHPKPIPDKWVFRTLVALIIILSLMAGFYHSSLQAEMKRYARLEDLYVRVRNELGREETQRLIDVSREKEFSDQ